MFTSLWRNIIVWIAVLGTILSLIGKAESWDVKTILEMLTQPAVVSLDERGILGNLMGDPLTIKKSIYAQEVLEMFHLQFNEAFPEEKAIVFRDFEAFCRVMQAEDLVNWLFRRQPVSYEDFMMSVFLSLNYISKGDELTTILKDNYMWLDQKVLEPLSQDLKQATYKNCKMSIDGNFLGEMREYMTKLYDRWKRFFERPDLTGLGWPSQPRSLYLAREIYAGTLRYINEGTYQVPYRYISYSRSSTFFGYDYQAMDDNERRVWLEFYYEELRHFGHQDYIEEIKSKL
jgi:hypothetical protein